MCLKYDLRLKHHFVHLYRRDPVPLPSTQMSGVIVIVIWLAQVTSGRVAMERRHLSKSSCPFSTSQFHFVPPLSISLHDRQLRGGNIQRIHIRR